jgi:hypothetical protein
VHGQEPLRRVHERLHHTGHDGRAPPVVGDPDRQRAAEHPVEAVDAPRRHEPGSDLQQGLLGAATATGLSAVLPPAIARIPRLADAAEAMPVG